MVFCWASCTFETAEMMIGGRLKREEGGGEPAFGFTQLIYKEEEGLPIIWTIYLR